MGANNSDWLQYCKGFRYTIVDLGFLGVYLVARGISVSVIPSASATVLVHVPPDFACRPPDAPSRSPKNEAVEPHTIAIITRFCGGVVT